MSPPEHRATETLIEAATTAWRPRSPSGEICAHPAWVELDVAGCLAANEAARPRRLEAAPDPDGLSTPARAVLTRLALHDDVASTPSHFSEAVLLRYLTGLAPGEDAESTHPRPGTVSRRRVPAGGPSSLRDRPSR
jgi:DNA-directed RNA polymerase specialized sigma24 family protein